MPLCLALKHLIAVESSFSQVVDYARAIKRACTKTYGDGSKSPGHPYNSIGVPFRNEDPHGRGQFHLQPIDSTFIVSLTLGGSQVSRGDHNRQRSPQTFNNIWYVDKEG